MKRRILLSMLVLSAVTMAIVFGVTAYRSASAATNTPNTPLVESTGHMGKDIPGGYSNEDLADALGITVDELSAARQEAKNAAIDQAVEQGLITQAQADQLKESGFAFPFAGHWGGWLSQNGIDWDVLLADALGISVDELQAASQQAHNARIDQAVANGAITEEQGELMKGRYALFSSESFRSAMGSAFESAVEQAVTAGVITQAQADLILERVNAGSLGGLPGLGGFEGGRGKHGGEGGFFFNP